MKKFNPKTYQGKNRIYPPVTGAPNVRRILVWDEARKEYRPPSRGKIYVARRYEVDVRGKRKRKSGYFESLEDARNWQSHNDDAASDSQQKLPSSQPASGPTFQEIVIEWKKRKFPLLGKSSRIFYGGVSRRHFKMLSDYPINSISSKVIDLWLADRKANKDEYRAGRRFTFDRELMILGLIFRYYEEYYEEDTSFRNPIKKRHWKDAKLNVVRPAQNKDLERQDFELMKAELKKTKYGKILSPFATTQYHEALRVSEVAALKWKHIIFNKEDPKESRIIIEQHVIYTVENGELPSVEPGFKNSAALGGTKALPMLPETYAALLEHYGDGIGKDADDYVFPNECGDVFRYHIVHYWYNYAFNKAGLKYTATHVMRHGGTNEVFDATGGDYGIAGQLLGDVSDRAIKTYAKRRRSALTAFVQGMWTKEALSR
jgi:integrase